MHRIRWWLPALLLVACQSAPPSAPPTIQSFEADPPTIHAGQPSRLSWSVTGATELSIAPSVGGVTGTTQVYVDPVATTTYTLTASNAAGDDSRQTTVTVDASVTISGIVLAADGRPLPNARLAVHGLPETTSGGDGRFTVPGVTPPYDVTLFHATDASTVTYLGVTEAEPTLVLFGPQPGAPNDVAVAGTVSGGTTFPQPAAHLTRVAFGSDLARAEIDASGTTGHYEFVSLTWRGAATLPGALHALQWRHDAGGLPVDYVGHGYRPVTLDAGAGTHAGQDMALLGPIAEGSLSGTVTLPASYGILGRALSVTFDDGASITTALQGPLPGPAFAYATPDLPGADMAIVVVALHEGLQEGSIVARTGLPATAAGVTIAVPGAPQLVLPAADAVGVGLASEFSWSAAAGVSALSFTSPGHHGYAVITAGDRAMLPDLSAYGVTLPPGVAYQWRVLGFPALAGIDDVVGDADAFLDSWRLYTSLLPWGDGAITQSAARAATTPP